VVAPTALLLVLTACGGGGQDDTGMAEPSQSAETSPSASGSESPSAESSESAEPSAGASSEPSMSTEPSQQAAEEVVVTIRSFEYEMPESVPAGATITVVNEDSELHTFTATGDGASIDLDVPGGMSATVTAPEQPGSYEVVCELHGGMEAVLEVS